MDVDVRGVVHLFGDSVPIKLIKQSRVFLILTGVLGESSVADFVRNRPCVPYGIVDLDYSVNNDLGSKLYKIPFSHRECVCGA